MKLAPGRFKSKHMEKKRLNLATASGEPAQRLFADAFQMHGFRFVLHRAFFDGEDCLDSGWSVSEYSTGRLATPWEAYNTPTAAIKAAKETISFAGKEKTTAAISSLPKINE